MGPCSRLPHPQNPHLLLAALLLASTCSDICVGRKVVNLPSDSLRASAQKDPHLINTTQQQLFYKNNKDLEDYMKVLIKKCGSIMRLYSIGTSVLGFPLWVLEISDKPGVTESEPAFKYVGNLHGDEPVGRELLLLLGDWLCENYRKDPLATLIVRDVHLHLLPSMNPDGFERRSRNNANNVDLNRDFPDQFFPQNDNEDLRQPETRAIMRWTRGHNFVASASLHGGALVANYPWDGTPDGRTKYSQCDDDKNFRYLAKVYSGSHVNMRQSTEFLEGVTNGAAWYPLYGGMQDWNYIHGKCMDLTLEITEKKWPAENEVFAQNKYGDYHRLLSPGQHYEVTASIPGYVSQTALLSVQEGKATYFDFKLQPLALDHGEGAPNRENATGFDLKDMLWGKRITHLHEAPKSLVNESSLYMVGFHSESFQSVKDSLLEAFALRREQLKLAYDGDVINELVTGHLMMTNTCLTLGVLLLFIFFVYRYRACFKAQKTKTSRHTVIL